MRYLSLFSGAGFGDLAHQRLLGSRCIGYVEWDEYSQRVLAARQADGWLDEAPIFGDVRAFVRDGYAERYRGVAECVTAGFPCQPFSVAGARRGADDGRDMWPATRDVIGAVRPQLVFLENVPGLLTVIADGRPYIHGILGSLAELGYDCRWGVVGADDAGAPHRRKRWWCLAYRPRRG